MPYVFLFSVAILVFAGVIGLFIYPPNAGTKKGEFILIFASALALVSFSVGIWSLTNTSHFPC